jgi:small-conductance mechanosensitive channel
MLARNANCWHDFFATGVRDVKAWISGEWLSAHPLALWSIALGVGAVFFFAIATTLKILRARLDARAERLGHGLAGSISQVLRRTSWVVLALLCLMAGVEISGAPLPWSGSTVRHLWFVLLALQGALWLERAVDIAVRRTVLTRGDTSIVTATLLGLLLRTFVWVVALLAMLDNLGINITALVASLGIGGVAVALAVQTILSDLFASISIGLDKPFEVGDFIVFGQVAGSIEHIGLKTTRIRSLGGEQIVCSNTELLKQTIQNYKRMQQRRIIFTVRVTYKTDVERAARVPGILRDQICGQADVKFDRAHLARFGDSALEYEAVYYLMSADYNRYMDTQQAINLGIMRDLQAAGIALALPERIVHLTAPEADDEGDSDPGSAFAPARTPASARN